MFFFLSNRSHPRRGLARAACTRPFAEFIFRSRSAESIFAPVSTRISFTSSDSRQPEGHAVPLGFCSGGYSSTAGYVPGNEAQQFRRTASKPSAIGTQSTRGCFGLPGVLNFSPPLTSRPRVLLKPVTISPEYRALKSLLIVLAMATPQLRSQRAGLMI